MGTLLTVVVWFGLGVYVGRKHYDQVLLLLDKVKNLFKKK